MYTFKNSYKPQKDCISQNQNYLLTFLTKKDKMFVTYSRSIVMYQHRVPYFESLNIWTGLVLRNRQQHKTVKHTFSLEFKDMDVSGLRKIIRLIIHTIWINQMLWRRATFHSYRKWSDLFNKQKKCVHGCYGFFIK